MLKEDYNSGRLSELYSSLVNQHQISVIVPIKNEFPDFFSTLESLNQSWLSFCEKSSCEKEKILKGISSVINGVASKTTMPILEGILIQTNDNELKLTSYDLEIGIEYILEAKEELFAKEVYPLLSL